MSQAPPIRTPPPGTSLRLSNVDWETYTRLLRIFAERPGIRLTYDRGELEIMSPLFEHDKDDRFLFRLVVTLTEELGLPVVEGGSSTMRRRKRRRGLEPDECYWIANAHRVVGLRRINLRTDPPPDLAIEVDVTHGSLDRMSIYAALGVPELWRLDGANLTFYVLGTDGSYSTTPNSRTFPLATPADLLGFMQQARQSSESNAVIRQFRAWIQQRQAAEGGPSANP